MPKYLIDIDHEIDDCAKCPIFNYDFDSCDYFDLEKYIDYDFKQNKYHVPDWCPLERVSDKFVINHRKAKALGKTVHFVIFDEMESDTQKLQDEG